MPATYPVTRAELDIVLWNTEDAYSHDRYRSWRACAAALLREGYTTAEAICILNSKVTRWASDHSDKPYGRATAKDLLRYVRARDNKAWIRNSLLPGRW
jgi:uncharacterized protein YdaT